MLDENYKRAIEAAISEDQRWCQRLISSLEFSPAVAEAYERAARVVEIGDLLRWTSDAAMPGGYMLPSSAKLQMVEVPPFAGFFLAAVVPDRDWPKKTHVEAAAAMAPVPFLVAPAAVLLHCSPTVLHEIVHLHQALVGRHKASKGSTDWFAKRALEEAEAYFVQDVVYPGDDQMSSLFLNFMSSRGAAIAMGWMSALRLSAYGTLGEPEELVPYAYKSMLRYGPKMAKKWGIDGSMDSLFCKKKESIRFAKWATHPARFNANWDALHNAAAPGR